MAYHTLEFLLLTFLLSTLFSTNYAQLGNTTKPEVTILQGTLQGITLTTRKDRNVAGFLGIRFAQPPTGNRRFANPVPADGWTGTLNASVDGSMCPQIVSNVLVGEEDCLYLNVYTPQLPQTTNSSLLPVMVFIHGGGFVMGSSDSMSYGPGYLLDEDVVLVTANYRLGPLGFLNTGDEVAPGNWGLKDQVLALKWVQDNIQYFGGDPGQVTIFGGSAGAVSVHLLTLSNSTIGLFHRFITQSGSALAPWSYRPRAAYSKLAFQFGTYIGCSNDTSNSLISCLRTVELRDIIATVPQMQKWKYSQGLVWAPTDELDIGGAFLTDSPSNLIAAGKIRDLPWISGVVRDEGLLLSAAFGKDVELLRDFVQNFDSVLSVMLEWTDRSDLGAAWVNATKSYYFNDDLTSNTSLLVANLTNLVGDSSFFYPAVKALRQHNVLAQNPQYFYTLNYQDDPEVDDGIVLHGDENLYLFPKEADFLGTNKTVSETDNEMIDTIVQLWTSFAINGKPTVSSQNDTIIWEPYNSTEDTYLRIGNYSDTALEIEYSFLAERMQFWTSIDVAEETEASGAITSSSNLLYLFSITCGKFILSLALDGRLG